MPNTSKCRKLNASIGQTRQITSFVFMFTSNYRRCPLAQKFTGSVLNLSKSCTFCPLGQTWLEISVKNCHVQCT
ncbi:hypothetical protein Hanom_Chr04g00374691 [Helianthus anomalus]